MKIRVMSIAVACFVSALQAHAVNQPINIGESLDYELLLSRVENWASGAWSGEVSDFQGDTASRLDDFMAKTERTLELAVYGVSRQSWVFSRLRGLLQRNVDIRAVVDQMKGSHGAWEPENFTYPDTHALRSMLGPDAIIPDLNENGTPRTASIMHNKFIVRDKRAVWFGTTNLSHTGIGNEYNANSSLIIKSDALARIYSNEFAQMFSKRRFSRAKQPRAARQPLRYKDGSDVTVYFSPQDNALEAAVLPFIKSAKRSIDIGMFYLTDQRISDALVAAHRNGVRVRLILDAVAARHMSSKHHEMREAGIPVKVENWGGKMHMKTAVSDGRHTLIGSMNWSWRGSHYNDENTVIIRNNANLGGELVSYLNRLWEIIPGSGSEFSSDPAPESFSSINSCYDGIDNNHNQRVDNQDYGCR